MQIKTKIETWKVLTLVGTGLTDGRKLYSPLEDGPCPDVSIPIQSAKSTGLASAVERPIILVGSCDGESPDDFDSICREINLVRLTIASRTAYKIVQQRYR